MKLKKYSLSQLRENYPVLSESEQRQTIGGYLDVGGGFVQLSYSEMCNVFGELETMPGIELQGYEFFSEGDPANSYINTVGFTAEPWDNEDREPSLLEAINALLEIAYTETESSQLFSPSERTYLVPISSLGVKAQEWGLTPNDVSSQQSSSSSGSVSNSRIDEWVDMIIRDIAVYLRCWTGSIGMRDLRTRLSDGLHSIEGLNDQIYWDVSYDTYTCNVKIFRYGGNSTTPIVDVTTYVDGSFYN